MSTLFDLTTRLSVALPVVSPSPAPSPSYGQGLDANEISPGLIGFIPVFAIALVCIGLFLSFTKHMRIASVRAARLEEQEAKEAQGAAAATPDAPSVPGTDAGGDEPR